MFCGWSFSVVGPLRPLSAFGLDQRYSTCIFMVTLKHGLGSLKVIWTDYMYWSATYDFLLTFRSNHEPMSYHFRDKWWFQSKITKFSHHCILHPHWWGSPWNSMLRVKKLEWWANFSHPRVSNPHLSEGLPLQLCIGAWGQKLEWGGYRAEKEVWQHLQPSGYNTWTWRTDGHRARAKTALSAAR